MTRDYRRVGIINAPSDLGLGNCFGCRVDISGDGSTIFILNSIESNTYPSVHAIPTEKLSDAVDHLKPAYTKQYKNSTVTIAVSSDGQTLAVADMGGYQEGSNAYILELDKQCDIVNTSNIANDVLGISIFGDGQLVIVIGSAGIQCSKKNSSVWTSASLIISDLGYPIFYSFCSCNSSAGILIVSGWGNSVNSGAYGVYPFLNGSLTSGGLQDAVFDSGGDIVSGALSANGTMFCYGLGLGANLQFLEISGFPSIITNQNSLITNSVLDTCNSIALSQDGSVGFAGGYQNNGNLTSTVYLFDDTGISTSFLDPAIRAVSSIDLSYDGTILVIGDCLGGPNSYGAVYVYADRFSISDIIIEPSVFSGNSFNLSFNPVFSNLGAERQASVTVEIEGTILRTFTVNYGENISQSFGPVPYLGSDSMTAQVKITLVDESSKLTIFEIESITVNILRTINVFDLEFPTITCAGSTFDLSFLIDSVNGSGTSNAVLNFNNSYYSDSFQTSSPSGKIFWIDTSSSDFGLYSADFNPQISNSPYNVIFSPFNFPIAVGAVGGFCIDWDNNIIYVSFTYSGQQTGNICFGSLVLDGLGFPINLQNENLYYPNGGIPGNMFLGEYLGFSWLDPDASGNSIGGSSSLTTMFVQGAPGNVEVLCYFPVADAKGICLDGSNYYNQDNSSYVFYYFGTSFFWVQASSVVSLFNNDMGNQESLSGSQLTLNPSMNQITGMFLSGDQVYWVNVVSPGIAQLWQGTIDNPSSPSAILNPIQIPFDFGGATSPSGLFINFDIIPSSSMTLKAPIVVGSYPFTLTVYDSDRPSTSDVVTGVINVVSIQLSDISVPTSVVSGSLFEISYMVNIQDPTNSDALCTLTISGDFSGSISDVSDLQLQTFSFIAPCFQPVDDENGQLKISIQAQSQTTNCMCSSDLTITLEPLKVTAIATPQSVSVDHSTVLSVVTSIPADVSDVQYIWQPGNLQGPVQTVFPSAGTSSYTVTVMNGPCVVSDSVNVSVSALTFSDLQMVSHYVYPTTGSTYSFYSTTNFAVSFYAETTGQAPISDALATFNGSDYFLGTGSLYTCTFKAPCMPGIYPLVLTVRDVIGTTAVLTESIHIHHFPVTITPSNPTVSLGQSVTLMASTTPAFQDVSYHWTSNSAVPIQNSDFNTITVSPLLTTTYSVVATRQNCSFSDSATVIVEPYITLSDISYAPNPVVAGSPVHVTFTPTIFNGGLSDTVSGSLSMGNNSTPFSSLSDGVSATVSVAATCTSGPLTIVVFDTYSPSAMTSDVIQINVTPLTITAEVSPQLIQQRQRFKLMVSDPVSDGFYQWFSESGLISIGSTIYESTNSPFETYTVKIRNGSCYATGIVNVGAATTTIFNLDSPQQLCVGSTFSDISFQVEAVNGTGKVHATATFNNQNVFSSDIDYTWQMFFANASNASTAGVYMSQFIPLLNGPINTTFLGTSTAISNAINSVYFDSVNQNLYCAYADNQLWVIGNPQSSRPTFNPINLSNLNNPYGLFVDSENDYIYWVNAGSNNISVAQISSLNDASNITAGNPSILLSESYLNAPSGFFLDITTQNVYWTNLSDNSLWKGTLDSLTNPTKIMSPWQLTGGSLNQPTGVVVNLQDGTIYWLNSVNGGELWQAKLWPSLKSPTKLINTRLLSSGNFGTTSDPNTLPSGLCIIFPEMTYGCSITAPSVGGNYDLVLTVSDSDLSSASYTTTINVSRIVFSDLNVPSTVLAGSAIDVSLIPIITSGNSNDSAFITIALSDTPSVQPVSLLNVSDNQVSTISLYAPCVASDKVKTLTITLQNSNNSNCSITSDVQITIQALNIEILAFMSDFVTPILSDTILSGQEIILSVNNPLPGVQYSWYRGSDTNFSDTIFSDTPTKTTTYTVIAKNGKCWNTSSITINVNTPRRCVFLSDVQFNFKRDYQQSSYRYKLTLTGYQLSPISDATRTLQLSVDRHNPSINITQEFSSDGPFTFDLNNADTVLLEETVVLTAFIAGNPLCVPNIVSDYLTPRSLSLTIPFAGSAFTPVFYLPPDLADLIDPQVSDMAELFSTMCTYANQQQCSRFIAGLEILENSDFLQSDSPILSGYHLAFVFCSDNNFYAEEIFQGFNFVVNNFTSDSVVINHSDSIHGATSRPMQRVGFSVAVAEDKMKWWSPQSASPAHVNVKSSGNLFDQPLLVVNGSKNAIVDIDEIIYVPICNTLTTEAGYVCQLYNTAQQMVGYLESFYPDYSDLVISDKNQVTYNGEIDADSVFIDLDCGTINFSNFFISCFSDSICF